MTVLLLASFPDSADADRAAAVVMRLCRAGEAATHGAASARWHLGADRPAARHYAGDRAVGVVDWSFWGLLFGLAFRLPLAAAARGSAGGLGPQMLGDIGITDQFLNRLRDDVVPGRSGLLVLAPDTSREPIAEALRPLSGRAHWLDVVGSDARALWETFVA